MKTIEQILAEEKAAQETFEAKETYKGHTIAQLRKVFEAIENPEGWKKPWAASVPHPVVNAVLVAVEFFHADKARIAGIEPITGNVLMSGNGYQA
jgi:hypothetical protein